MDEYALMTNSSWEPQGKLKEGEIPPTPITTLTITPTLTPAQTQVATPVTTPLTTLTLTLMSLPRREGGAVTKTPKQQHAQANQAKQGKDP